MRLLIWLSVAYAAILVAALATILLMILVRLRRIHGALRPVAAALDDVSGRTLPLHSVVSGLVEALVAMQGEVKRVAEAIIRSGAPLGISPPESPTAQAGATGRWAGGPE